MANPMPTHTWHAKATGAYARTSTEAIENAMCIYEILHNQGWTLNAVSGVLGNIGWEGGYNPWRWYNDSNTPIPSSTDTSALTGRAYGLVQFYPSQKYISDSRAQVLQGYGPNFSDITGSVYDGEAQMLFVNAYGDYLEVVYQMSYQAYKTSNDTPEYLALVWLYNYERPGTQTPQEEARRQSEARYWYDLLAPYDPDIPPTPPTPISRSKMPVWMMALKRIH